ncbi:sensor histidine kinase [Chryseobacterium sp.]|uniref:HAMP domain-containing sensor histidine kinase n=1 Tax=Chryseobacterium sp. TaxID=1871047 RepID=UPI0025BF37B0|nr:sensor histidine kinase [Chryseobacterium sp.]
MKIRTRLSLLFTLTTAIILLLFAAAIYYSAAKDREKEFYSLLKKEAYTKANLFFDADITQKTLQEIYKNNRKILNEVEVAIYDTHSHLLYHDAVDIDMVKETPEMLKNIYDKKEIRFYQHGWQVVGLRYTFQNENFLITATAYDEYGYTKMNNLRNSSIFIFVLATLVIFFTSIYFSKQALSPVREMTKKAKNISASHLDLRLEVKDNKDELAELTNTFNEMLTRLENSFEAQKLFVSNTSHELRTPLTRLLTELELSEKKQLSNDEYAILIHNLTTDVQQLIKLSNSLLDLARANYDRSKITFKTVRVDEILLDARHQVQKMNPQYKISIHFDTETEDDSDISIEGNAYLLQVAFANLFENGCKFSSHLQSNVSITYKEKKIELKFSDSGIGISEEDLKHIFNPFFRGDNKYFTEGNGIGLSLTKKIIEVHNGSIKAYSELHKGTIFIVELPT